MMIKRVMRITTLFLSLMLFHSGSALAGTPLPTIQEPEGEGVKCVHPEEEMRRNHMNYIMHQRDRTVHDGIRTETYSLAKCIDCHVEPNDKGEVASIDSKEHFCSSCHTYAAVQIDCFQCHADKPQKFIKRTKTSAMMKELRETLALKGDLK